MLVIRINNFSSAGLQSTLSFGFRLIFLFNCILLNQELLYTEGATAEFVLPAVFLRDGLLDTLEPLRQQLDGKVYIDISNPFNG
ncbi:MAG: hypothetical protein I4N51_06770 [Acinetobacter sp.]|nr:hypothetical protein [Acinetobacter sp.]